MSISSTLRGDTPVFINNVKATPGRVTANNVVVELSVQRIALPSKMPIATPIRCDIKAAQLASNTGGPIAKVCELPGFDQAAGDEIMFTRQSVTIMGSFA